ncbi:Ger(x)C family spore germination protein [Niallia circulans]|uniref:Ger(X)C family spore germination protein n=1 Tax=Niallia circulans TaxID=1397 RepID=A0A553SIR3_NIACI|nr:Ger(x)C family spore germination protein [Niallia circulans]TRZ36876.1 Ger(x)C family spore germination protein [Niallia circulans]
MKKIILFHMFLAMLVLLGACSGKREISDLALVMAVGIDKGEKEGTVKITAQVARPADARGQTGAPSGQSGEAVWSVETEGESIFEAIRQMSSFSSRRVFWAHNFIIVINEEVAKEGIGDVIDFFTRNPELRMRTWVAVTPQTASEVISTVTSLEIIPGEALAKLFRYTTISNQAPRTVIMDVLSAYLSESTEPLLARLDFEKSKIDSKAPDKGAQANQVVLAGAGVFKEDKLIGILKPEELRGVLIFREKIDSGVAVVGCPDNTNTPLSVELTNQSFDVKPKYKDGNISYDAAFQAKIRVVEAGCALDLSDEKQVKKLESSVDKELTSQINTTIAKIQKDYKSDVLELGKVFQNKYPYEWKHYASSWEEIFPEVKINLQVTAKLESGSLLYKPTTSGKKEKEEK